MKHKSIFIIAEAGVNHNGSMQLAKQLIDAAVEAKADAVKFQTFIAEEVISKHAQKADYQKVQTGQDETQLEMVKKLQLSFDDFIELKKYCESKKIMFLSTAFDLKSVDFLKKLNMGIWKIPSGEITNLPYLKKIGAYGEKVIFSTGMATLGDIENALSLLIDAGTDKQNITILHCNTEYPTPMKDVNLNAMLTIKKAFGVQIGYSDHTLGIEISVAAAAMGATVIEKHFTLDQSLSGPDHKASLNPGQLAEMVTSIRHVEEAMGNGIKIPSVSEKKNTEIARKSIHVSKLLKKGHILTDNDLTIKRPGNGISPMLLPDIIGCSLNCDLEEDSILHFKHIAWK